MGVPPMEHGQDARATTADLAELGAAWQAAMPQAAPHSAWHPPTAPAMDAFSAITLPMAPAVKRAQVMSYMEALVSSATAERTAGTMPQEPAVGQATMRYIFALASAVAMA